MLAIKVTPALIVLVKFLLENWHHIRSQMDEHEEGFLGFISYMTAPIDLPLEGAEGSVAIYGRGLLGVLKKLQIDANSKIELSSRCVARDSVQDDLRTALKRVSSVKPELTDTEFDEKYVTLWQVLEETIKNAK